MDNLSLADACPVCDPGFAPAAYPLGLEDASGLPYRCTECGATWRTTWDSVGWPIERQAA